MINAKVIVSFFDLQDGIFRDVGDAFPVEEERGKYLSDLGFVEIEKPKKKKKKSE